MKVNFCPSVGDLYSFVLIECFYEKGKMKHEYLLKVSDFVMNIADWLVYTENSLEYAVYANKVRNLSK